MIQGERLLRGSGVSQQVTVPDNPYRRFGNPDWDPARLGPMDVPAPGDARAPERARAAHKAHTEARIAEFARYRDEGLGVEEAGAAVGVRASTAKTYERRRKAGAA